MSALRLAFAALLAAPLGALLAALLGALLGATACSGATQERDRRVVLISLDGFRADYIARPAARRLRELAARGVRAERMEPVFPTKTFPNHYTIVTGLYPYHHGIVSNTMRDSLLGAFGIGDNPAARDGRWWGGEPIWVTAEKQGVRSAAYFWPGTEAEIGGVRPHWYFRYDGAVPRADRLRQVLAWLAMPADSAPRLITTYLSDTDDAGHRFGPDAPETDSAIAKSDSVIGALVDGIARLGLAGQVDLIVVSDHGMVKATRAQTIVLDDYVSLDSLTVVDWSPITAIAPNPGAARYVYDRLHGAHPKFDVYWKADVPARFHYDSGARIMPIIGIAADGWRVTTRARARNQAASWSGGDHGYDNQLPSMQTLFVAAGPSFRQGTTVPSLANVHIYPLIAHILGLRPARTDGSLDSVRALLRP